VLPEFLVESLGLSSEQKDKLAALQKEVDTQLAAILTDEQKKEMENHQPPQHGPGHGEGGREGGSPNRPQRPQRPQ
jgi:Spy/CpxP family protein refolding chaperone